MERLRLVALLLALAAASATAQAGDLRGEVTLEVPGVAVGDIGPVVAYLERTGGGPVATPELPEARVIQEGARFSPAFLVVTRGQPVAMPNADAIYHNVFSFSRPNDFDLGLYPAGESRTIRFAYAGVVRIYCSIHESMNATLFVAPEPWHAIVSPTGRFKVEDVPPGRYRLSLWSERLAGTSVEVDVTDAPSTRVDVQWSPLSEYSE